MAADNKPSTVDEYLAAVPEKARVALQQLRTMISSAAPDATEAISYGIPTFRHHGSLVSFGAAKNHCAFYVQSPGVMEAHADDLKGYDVAKATIRFAPDKPLPSALVKKLVKARMKENESLR
jgi:uncharacterized protein YdhG (YjbR/CyaY superfamily)